MLESPLQPRSRPRFLPARLVRQGALLFKAVPRQLCGCGRAAEAAATGTERPELLRVAFSAADRESSAGAGARPCQGALIPGLQYRGARHRAENIAIRRLVEVRSPAV